MEDVGVNTDTLFGRPRTPVANHIYRGEPHWNVLTRGHLSLDILRGTFWRDFHGHIDTLFGELLTPIANHIYSGEPHWNVLARGHLLLDILRGTFWRDFDGHINYVLTFFD